MSGQLTNFCVSELSMCFSFCEERDEDSREEIAGLRASKEHKTEQSQMESMKFNGKNKLIKRGLNPIPYTLHTVIGYPRITQLTYSR